MPKGSRKGCAELADAYIRKIYHETLQISVIQRLEAYLKIEARDDSKVDKRQSRNGKATAAEDKTVVGEDDEENCAEDVDEEDEEGVLPLT